MALATFAPARPAGFAPHDLPQIEATAASYVRQSSAKADKTEASPMVQREANEAETVRREARFFRHFEDIGVSGWNPDAYREGFEAMLTAARNRLFNMLVVYDVSRFSRREVADAIPIVTELHRLGITIVSVMDGVFAPRDTMALIYLIMRLDAGHQESQKKSKKVRAVKVAQRSQRSWLGGQAPYGFESEKYLSPDSKYPLYRLVHVVKEAMNLRRIWATIKKYMHVPIRPRKFHPGSLSGICTDMNKRGVPTKGQNIGKERTRSQWSVRTLKGILMNPVIAGMSAEPIYRVKEDGTQTKTVVGYRIHRDEDGRPVMICEPIIPPAEWYELQDWLSGRGQGEGLARGESLLSGLRDVEKEPVSVCECNRPLKGLNSGPKPVYKCTRASQAVPVDGEHESGNSAMQSHVDDFVARKVFALIQDATRSDPAAETVLAVRAATTVFSQAKEDPKTAAERHELKAERDDAQRAINELYDALDAGLYEGPVGRERFLKRKTNIEGRLERAKTRLESLSAPETVELPLSAWLHNDGDSTDPLGEGSWWASVGLDERRKFIAMFVRRVTIKRATKVHAGRVKGGYKIDNRVAVEFVRPVKAEAQSAEAFELSA
ncbi:recombinase family protein [Streptomyces catenulae]|uniref:Recombinase family protein n=1 Tax=Streptomyces catenulae TaxID=66875 RepID=A0ABV2Z6L6_9ACTN|nr:recombinase family protein [Streptomyces catenulae]